MALLTPRATVAVRPATQQDLDTLWDFLAIAAYEPDAAASKRLARVAAHLIGWQRPGDFGFIAEQDDAAIGAIKARQFAPGEPGLYIGERTPELSIAVTASQRGQGIGEMLLRALIVEASRRAVRLCLAVRDDNPALRLYRRVGFEVLHDRTVPSRAGGLSLAMILRRQ